MRKAKQMSRYVTAVILTTMLGGCVVEQAPGPVAGPGPYAAPAQYPAAQYPAPAQYAGPAEYAPPPNVVYVRPAYASPGAGYIWRYHRHYGWGWWHPHYGWHRGWVAY